MANIGTPPPADLIAQTALRDAYACEMITSPLTQSIGFLSLP
jgi:hypothetical protein